MRLAEFMGVFMTRRRAEEIAGRHSFEERTGRVPGDSDNTQFRRKGIVGDGKNYR